jgi:hypothetical protein
VDKTEFYQHDQNWSNRMILGDSLQVMASLAEREGLRSKVQCIYLDPPYGIKFNSNFQWSTTSRDVKDGNTDHITREPEQVKAFRDTWRDGIHSYLTYLRDRLTVARDLLTDSGSIFVQIGDENVHRVRALMDEVFGEKNFVSTISVQKTSYATADFLPNLFESAYPLRSGWLAGLGRLKDGDYRLKPPRLISGLLFSDVPLHGFQLVAHRGYGIAPRPEMLAREVLQLPPQLPRNGQGTLPLQKPNHRGHSMLGWDLHTHMDMVGQQMPLHDPTFLLAGQLMKDRPQALAELAVEGFAAIFRNEHDMILAFPA